MSDIVLSIAWLTPENFIAHRFLDPKGLPETYGEWLADAQSAMVRLAELGHLPERVVIDANELARWCAAEGRKVDGAARAAFVVHVRGRRHGSGLKADLLSAPSLFPIVDDGKD